MLETQTQKRERPCLQVAHILVEGRKEGSEEGREGRKERGGEDRGEKKRGRRKDRMGWKIGQHRR